ncbi:MAG: hypothetical protein K2Y39_09670 [Candidatus Obscuribacterales bacterium]|nr:hypothetical protein [Candidatus Obscuribacterales bacterium]
MALINSFERGDGSGSGSQNSSASFFDWNTEMRAANSTKSNYENIAPAGGGGGSRNEPDFIDFGDCTRTYKNSEYGLTTEYTTQSRAEDKVVYINDRGGEQTFRYDPESRRESTEQQYRQDQSQQLAEALQNFVRALTTICMLYSRWLQQNYAGAGGSGGHEGGYGGGNGNGGSDTGSGGYDMPTPGPDGPIYEQPSAPRPSRPRPQPSAPRPPRGDSNSGNTGNDKGGNDGNNGNDGNTGNIGDGRGNTDSPSGSRYADTGVVRGRTIFRDDFNGARGEKPNQQVFDTAHIGADGKTRQRGPSIDEDGIIDVDNTVQDGKGHLQLFAERERTYDPVAKEYVNYTKGSMHTTEGLNFNLKDHPEGVVVEVRAKHPTADGAKFNALWLMTERWGADPAKGEVKGDTIEYDAAEGGGADIAIHYPVKDMATGKSKDNYGGGAHPKDVDFNDGKFHTYTVVITPNEKTGRGDVVQYVDGKKVFQKDNVFPGDKDLHLKASMEVSPKWTKKTLTSQGGMDSDAAGVIDYIDVSELKRR